MKPALLMAALIPVLLGAHEQTELPAAIQLWNAGKVAFGVFVPNDAAARAAAYNNPLYDFLFLNLEQRYDAALIKILVQGLRGAASQPRKTLIVRIPPVEREGADITKARITEVFALGGDGVAVPQVRGLDEASQVLWFFRDTGLNVWSPANRQGDKLAMLMIEDPGALGEVNEIADLKGYSVLACGIGSLTLALGGDRAAAEAGNQRVLAETKRAKLVNMITTTTGDVEQRVRQGYLALIAVGPEAERAIRLGRALGPR